LLDGVDGTTRQAKSRTPKLVLRFFEGAAAEFEGGTALGASEDVRKKRVSGPWRKLQESFHKNAA